MINCSAAATLLQSRARAARQTLELQLCCHDGHRLTWPPPVTWQLADVMSKINYVHQFPLLHNYTYNIDTHYTVQTTCLVRCKKQNVFVRAYSPAPLAGGILQSHNAWEKIFLHISISFASVYGCEACYDYEAVWMVRNVWSGGDYLCPPQWLTVFMGIK